MPWYASEESTKRSQTTSAPRSSAGRITRSTSSARAAAKSATSAHGRDLLGAGEQQLADALAERRPAGLARQHDLAPLALQPLAEQLAPACVLPEPSSPSNVTNIASLRYGAVRALVTGGAGFIGSHLVDALLARGDEAHVLDNLATGSRDNLDAAARRCTRATSAPTPTPPSTRRGPRSVFHLAAQADVGTSVEQPELDADVNVLGTVRVLEAARRHGARVVFTSTGGAMYGECPRPAREDDPREPLAPYGASKLAGEEYLATWNRLHGAGHVSLRLANVYGPRQLPKLEGGVVAIFMSRLARGEGVQIFGDGEQARDFVHVGDVVAALLAAASAPTAAASSTSAPAWPRR